MNDVSAVSDARDDLTALTERSDAADAAGYLVAQQAAIAQIGQRALEQQSLDALLDEACVLVGAVLETEFVSIAELSADRRTVRIVAGVGWGPGLVGELVLGTGHESHSGYTLASGEPVIAADYATEKRFRVVDSLLERGVRSGMSVRIGGSETAFGTLSVFTAHQRDFTTGDANFLRAVANVLAAAVGRLNVERELRSSRDQLAAIVESIDEGITVRGATRLIFANDEAARLTGFASAQELVDASDEILARFEMFDEDGVPIKPEDLPGRRAMDGEQHPEAVVGFRVKDTAETRWSIVRGVAVREPSGDVASVISIFRDITEERWAAQARDYMSDAVAVLTSTLETAETAQRLADLSVPRLADYCTVSMLQDDGTIKLVALAHVNPERIQLIRRLEQMIPPNDINSPSGIGRVIREGIVERGEVTPEVIDALPLPGEVVRLLHQLELRTYVTVPLMGRHKPIGGLSLAMAESGRRIGDREQALAAELGARAGVALENARLFQAADARRAELDAVLSALAEAVLVFDGDGELRMSNGAASRTFGGSLPSTIDALWQRVGLAKVGGDGADRVPAAGDAVEVDVDRRGHWHDLRTYKASAHSHTPAHGEAAPMVVVMRDVTEVRAARAARDAFMGVLSHELRTPITTIYGGSELLGRGLGDEQRAEVIADIRAESERLARLVEDLLVMTRVERGIVEIADEPILLQHLIAAVIQATGARFPGARITFKAADRRPAVRGDATYTEQVVRNLLTNAMRYGDGRTKGVEVIAEQAPDGVAVRVLDRGNGLRGEDPDRLFELFYRSSSARSVPGGAGIGLFVCRNLIEKMGGRIWALERPEGGAEFGFVLPVQESDTAA
jgi:PAS domain S-box-containing protein